MVARSVGGKGTWVIGWVCGMGFFGFKSGTSVEMGSYDGLLLGL